ncbi:subtilisin-like protease SBT3.6 [Zingiber officinale]|uniref:subtilisin-like protease SBT3.6 n=1 Tax=Zingiber officinale TaxID=94328 RepID=UPI001C4A956C|nr:subtilisin-like protease SBT3.6 [Zingiber officinale]
MLTSVLGSKEEAIISIVYSYGFSGFAAKLSESKAKKIAELPEVVCIRPSRTFKHLTTHSWDFLGVDNSEPSGLLRRANHGEDIIIGVIDSGVWPEAKSFSDEGYGPVPARWKGKCVPGEHFDVHNCNRKLIGARYYKGPGVTTELQKGDYLSARDSGYHGTHVASIAAGNNVSNVNVYQMTGLPVGAARGGAPRARIAVYNVCWAVDVCSESDTIKAVKDAIQDGVDVISISLGSQGYLLDTLKAVKNGIPVILAGGNDGPTPMTITNEAPWAITVAATTIDRSFPTVIALGDGQKLVGQSFYGNRTKNLELVAPNCPRRPLCSCSYETLEGINAKGKVVFCYDPYNSDGLSPTKTLHVAFSTVNDMGAKGLILAQHPFNQIGRLRPEFPCILVDFEIAQRISDYYLHSIRPSVKIKAAKYAIGQEVAPRVAAFSSRGPSARQPELLKPDIAAPGHAIIGAVRNKFVFLSGTSMAAPHVSGVVALLKVIHPDWSPAAIKSALVTTASVTDAYGMPLVAEGTPRKLADPFDFGGGQINPNKAVDPGLVYDMDPYNYGILNCDKVFVESEDTEDCRFKFNEPKHDLNLPSIALPNLKKKLTVTRTITNVAGDARVVYKAVIDSPAGVKMVVQPSTLVFNANAKVKTFNVTFTPIHSIQGIYRFGSLAWDDGVAHYVRIPIAVRTVINYSYADAS